MGEITLRDGLVVAAAAAGARMRESWIIEREVTPTGWHDAPVDLMISKKTHGLTLVGAAELKWWRQLDAGNAANRRRDLVRDFIRAAALYPQVSDFSFVALLSTSGSWSATADTNGTDREAMQKLSAEGSQRWKLSSLIGSSAVKRAVQSLDERVPICNIFHTELLAKYTLQSGDKGLAFARVWRVKKPQNTYFLSSAQIAELTD